MRLLTIPPPVPRLDTVGRIAARLGVPIHVVTRIIATHDITESARVGTLRVFDRAAVAQIRQVLAERKGGAN